jgi:hypothetical protein
MMTTWTDLGYNRKYSRNEEVEKEVELVECDVLSYGLYEDLYKCNTLSVEQVYAEIWD